MAPVPTPPALEVGVELNRADEAQDPTGILKVELDVLSAAGSGMTTSPRGPPVIRGQRERRGLRWISAASIILKRELKG